MYRIPKIEDPASTDVKFTKVGFAAYVLGCSVPKTNLKFYAEKIYCLNKVQMKNNHNNRN